MKDISNSAPGFIKKCDICQHQMKTARTLSSESPADYSQGFNLENDVAAPTGYGYLLSLQYCDKCGFSAVDFAEPCSDDLRALVHSIPYQLQWSDESLPKLARVFLCKAILDLAKQLYVDAAYSALAAAWVCDDQPNAMAAIWCRKVAAEYFERFFKHNPRLAPAQQRILFHYVDVCHRAGLIQRAKQLCKIIALQPLDDSQQQHLDRLKLQLQSSDPLQSSDNHPQPQTRFDTVTI
jgi:hypothetical protein